MQHFSIIDSAVVTLVIGAVAAFLHGTFQVSASVLTLLSGHSLGARRSHTRLLALDGSYTFGVGVVIVGVLLGLVSLARTFDDSTRELWAVAIALCAVIGSVTSLVYYRGAKGTVLWLPRSAAEYLSQRAKKTRRSLEAASLGGLTVIAELPFTIAPLCVAALLIAAVPVGHELIWAIVYSAVAAAPLAVVTALLGSGHSLSRIQRWREDNRLFLQYSSGAGLVVIALYVAVFYLGGTTL